MKKFFIIIPLLFLIISHEVISSKVIINRISKWIERDVFIERVNIDYLNSELILEKLEVRGGNKSYYKNIFEADKIKIKYNFKSLFNNLIKIDDLYVTNTIFFFEVDDKVDLKEDRNIVKKIIDKNQQSKIYPKKKVDKNFIILKTTISNSRSIIKTESKDKEIKLNLSDMSFVKVGNAKEAQHFKDVFKILLGDLLLRIRDQKLREIIIKTYKL
tara:strand:+ start:864 stop:1508 length:645 start_codon:yes stop_codon:yes gene_type:complete